MVTLNGELASPLLAIFIPLIVLLFAFHKDIKNIRKLFYGMAYGIGIYGSLMLASYANDPTHGLGWITEFMSTSVGAMLYEALIGIIAVIVFGEFIIKKEASAFIVGIVISFSIFEVYFAVNCIETIPFMDEILKHQCV